MAGVQDEIPSGRVIYLLLLVALLLVIYPITLNENPVYLIFYQVVYTGMFAAALIVARKNHRILGFMAFFSVLWLTFGIMYALDPGSGWKIAATYAALIPFLLMIVLVLLRYIFYANHVDRDVLIAAVTVYLLLVMVFVPVYGLLELAAPGSLVDTLTGQPVFWQQMIYFSLATLTTTGYGDLLPATPWARVLANLEAVIGVIYIAVLMARLVSLYSERKANS